VQLFCSFDAHPWADKVERKAKVDALEKIQLGRIALCKDAGNVDHDTTVSIVKLNESLCPIVKGASFRLFKVAIKDLNLGQ
jgi:hypothetical protein